MIIDELVFTNFGVYKGRQQVTLTPVSTRKPVVLFGGQNGAGKTTLLDALQLVLYGKFARCSNRGNLSYEEFLRRSIHRTIDSKVGATLELTFRLVANGKEQTYKISRKWFQKGKSLREEIEVTKDGKPDSALRDSWDEYVEEFIPSRISSLFFFDGEKIEEFANQDNSAQLLSIALHSLLGLDIVDQLSKDLIVLERRKQISLKNDIERQHIEEAKSELEEIEEERTKLVQTRAALRNELDQRNKSYRQIEKLFRQEGGELFEKRDEIDEEKLSTRRQLNSVEDALRETAAGVAPLSLVSKLLQSLRQQDRREEIAQQAKALEGILKKRDKQLLEVARQRNAPEKALLFVEGFLLEDRKQRIKESKVKQYLNLDSETRKNLSSLMDKAIPDERNRSLQLSKQSELLQLRLENIERKIAGIPDKDLIGSLIKKRQESRLAIEETEAKISSINSEIERISFKRDQKQSSITFQIEKNVKDDFEHEDALRIVYHSLSIRDTLKEFRTTMIKNSVDRIGQLIFDGFNQLIRKQSLVKELSIDPEAFTLELRYADGKLLSPDRLSAGERQLLAVSILWGLARASGRPLPAAIDTPLGRLDASHRTHLIERYFPYASHQVLLFSTDEEINSTYYDKLKPYIGRTYLLDYDDNTGSTQIRKGYFN